MTPLVKMHTLGHDFIPEPIHAGGLRYHGMSPLVSLLKEHGDIEARSVHQRASFEAGVPVRAGRGDPAGARADARDPRRDRRGAGGQGGRRGPGHPVQPVRPRSLRPVRLRALPRRQPRGLRVPAREGRGRARRPAEGLTRGPHAPSSVPDVRAPDLFGRAAVVDDRRGAPLPALRSAFPGGSARRRAPDGHPAREPARRPGPPAATTEGDADADRGRHGRRRPSAAAPTDGPASAAAASRRCPAAADDTGRWKD